MDEKTLQIIRNKNAVKRARRALEIIGANDVGFRPTPSRAKRASEFIANQPVVQEIVARQLGIKK